MTRTTPSTTAALVMAKAPVPGRVKTRLCPTLSPTEAASVAEAALADTLDAVARCGADRLVLALDGEPGPWLPPGFEVVTQRGDGLDERLAAAWEDVGAAGVQVGMDTPQLLAAQLDAALAALDSHDAALGFARDGGWWAVALRRPDPACFLGVPMSAQHTGRAQHRRLIALGLTVAALPTLRDIDTPDDLAAVTGQHSHLRTSAVARHIAGVAA
jgi:rSAM/selenodomain-associated transferase 1